MNSPKILDRFWSKTTTDHDLWFEGTRCIIWTGAVNSRRVSADSQYGKFYASRGIYWIASRFAYTLKFGPIPAGLEVDHRCRRTLCVNWKHLEAVTPCENRRRAERHRVYSLTCPQGHLWTRTNMRLITSGRRKSTDKPAYGCVQCNRDRVRAAQREYAAKPIPKRKLSDLSPACRNNHPRTAKNTRFTNGVVRCLDCAREATQRWASKKIG